MRAEGRGTCSTKTMLLLEMIEDRPELEPRVVHRVYRIDRKGAERMFGPSVATAVPPRGLVDSQPHRAAIVNVITTAIALRMS